jgi:U11/U12 small nuclear ribonucleoprotein SNRNP65
VVPHPIAPEFGFGYPFPPQLQYKYPPPTALTLRNISKGVERALILAGSGVRCERLPSIAALVAVPRFYEQVLHLMNKMNLPPPFDKEFPDVAMPEDATKRRAMAGESDGGESDEDEEGDEPAEATAGVSHAAGRESVASAAMRLAASGTTFVAKVPPKKRKRAAPSQAKR